MRTVALAFVLSVFAIGSAADAQVIDFETTPAGGVPVDNAPLATPYNLSGGGTVEFYFDSNLNNVHDINDANAVFEAIGQDGTDGFANGTSGILDDPAAGFAPQLGNFFLRQPVSGFIPPPFIIDYNTSSSISALGGEIWDIDGAPANTEQWLLEVLDASNATVAAQLSPLGTGPSLDSKPWVFSFGSLPVGVDKVRITFVGSKTQGLGLAFNNFQPTTPEPSSLGTVALLALMKRRR